MAEKKIKKQNVDKIGRIFTMLFNRAVMYDMKHPFTTQSMGDFFRLISDELKKYTPIVLIMHQDKFFIEDEPLDARLNISKVMVHFKKTDIQSIQFGHGLSREDLEGFFNVMVDTIKFSDLDKMQKELTRLKISKLKLNHVYFKKVTVDDTVVEKDSVKSISEGKASEKKQKLKTELLDILTGGLAIDELGKSLSITQLFGEPEKLSKYVVHNGDTAQISNDNQEGGPVLLENIGKIKSEVDKASIDLKGSKLHDLAASVVKMKADLINGIKEKKKAGIAFHDEEQLIVETNALADNVILKLVRDEYKQGATSVKRLSQILRRLVPDKDELQRFLPKLKETLLIEGMSLDDFLELTNELETELANQNVSDAIKKSAEDIGVSGEELLREITSNPSEAAELIYLASELRKETGDKKALTDVLVEYIERVGSKIALDSPEVMGDEGKDHIKSVIANVESEIVSRLKSKEIEPNVLKGVSERLDERMDTLITKLEKSLEQRDSVFGTWDHETTSLLKIFEDNIEDTEQLKMILKQVRDKYVDATTGEFDSKEIQKSIIEEETEEKTKDDTKALTLKLPKGVHNRKSILYFIEREIARSSRYKTPFSAVTFSILKAIPQKKFAAGTVMHDDITTSVLTELIRQVRDTDLVGILDKKKIIGLLPMTDEEEAKLAMRRLLKKIHSNLFKVKGIPIEVKFAGTVTNFNKQDTPDLKKFVTKAERDIFEVVQRLKNLQSLY